MFVIIKTNDNKSMLWSLGIIYILFAERFKAKINTNIVRFVTFTFCILYVS